VASLARKRRVSGSHEPGISSNNSTQYNEWMLVEIVCVHLTTRVQTQHTTSIALYKHSEDGAVCWLIRSFLWKLREKETLLFVEKSLH
jgi:hypothetical protein